MAVKHDIVALICRKVIDHTAKIRKYGARLGIIPVVVVVEIIVIVTMTLSIVVPPTFIQPAVSAFFCTKGAMESRSSKGPSSVVTMVVSVVVASVVVSVVVASVVVSVVVACVITTVSAADDVCICARPLFTSSARFIMPK